MSDDSSKSDEGLAVPVKIEKPEVFRPGLLQYLFLVPPTAFFTVVGIAIAIAQPLSGYTFLAVGLSLVSGLVLLNVIGMRIELDDERLAKVYFFGLYRQSIAITQLRASVESDRRETSVWFESADGKGLGFGVIRSAVWRGRDVDRLYKIAATNQRQPASYPVRSSGPPVATTEAGSAVQSWAVVEPEGEGGRHEKPGSTDFSVRADEWEPASAHKEAPAFEDDPFFIILSATLGLSVLIGAVIGIQVHSWRSLLAFVGAFACVIPAAPYFAWGSHLPSSRMILWPVRTVVFVLTIGIPLTIWIVLIGSGRIAHEVVTFLGCMLVRQACG
jgi:hypothetical protein